MPITQESVEHARRSTSSAIALVAQYKWELETVRQDTDASAEKISAAAYKYREAEKELKERVDKEIEVLIEFAQRVSRGETPDPREADAPEGRVPIERAP